MAEARPLELSRQAQRFVGKIESFLGGGTGGQECQAWSVSACSGYVGESEHSVMHEQADFVIVIRVLAAVAGEVNGVMIRKRRQDACARRGRITQDAAPGKMRGEDQDLVLDGRQVAKPGRARHRHYERPRIGAGDPGPRAVQRPKARRVGGNHEVERVRTTGSAGRVQRPGPGELDVGGGAWAQRT